MGAAGRRKVQSEAVSISVTTALTSAKMPYMHASNGACSVVILALVDGQPVRLARSTPFP